MYLKYKYMCMYISYVYMFIYSVIHISPTAVFVM